MARYKTKLDHTFLGDLLILNNTVGIFSCLTANKIRVGVTPKQVRRRGILIRRPDTSLNKALNSMATLKIFFTFLKTVSIKSKVDLTNRS